jgi:cell fate regulator YaaT (PSP1 superfamily)
MSESRTVVAVKLRYNPKVFWFDPALSTYEAGNHVLVDTERGREIGLVMDPAVEVTSKQIKALKSPLKSVVRVLDENDFERVDELDAKGRAAMSIFRELIRKHDLDVKPVSVEFLFSGDKAVFYFSNDERVDFRDLVRDLAAHFHIRVDMRQIGVRDETRMLGGLAHCGEELCCARLGGEFQPVSIRMAKEQDLPLNPSKISGACGRLMCCLRYEFEAYRDFKNRAPKKGALIETPIGHAKVVDFDTPREIITMRLEDGKLLSIPLSEFGCAQDANGVTRPCCVSRDAIDRCASSSVLMALAALEQEAAQKEAPSGQVGERKRGRESVRGRENARGVARDTAREEVDELPARRLRRSGRRSAEGKQGADGRADGSANANASTGASSSANAGSSSGSSGRAGNRVGGNVDNHADTRAGGSVGGKRGMDGRRRGAERRASQPGRKDESTEQTRKQGESASKGSGNQGSQGETPTRGETGVQRTRPHPGQHSSGLRGADREEGRAANRASGHDREQAGEGSSRRMGGDGRRRRRPSNNSSGASGGSDSGGGSGNSVSSGGGNSGGSGSSAGPDNSGSSSADSGVSSGNSPS